VASFPCPLKKKKAHCSGGLLLIRRVGRSRHGEVSQNGNGGLTPKKAHCEVYQGWKSGNLCNRVLNRQQRDKEQARLRAVESCLRKLKKVKREKLRKFARRLLRDAKGGASSSENQDWVMSKLHPPHSSRSNMDFGRAGSTSVRPGAAEKRHPGRRGSEVLDSAHASGGRSFIGPTD